MAGIPGGHAVHALVVAVLDHGVRALATPEGLPVSLIQETGTGERTITTFTGVAVDAAVKAAREKAVGSTAERVAITWDGRLTGADGDHSAVMVLVHERGAAQTLVFAQRYEGRGTTIETTGAPGFAGERAPLLG